MGVNYNELKARLFEAATKAGFSDCEVYIVRGGSFSVRVHQGEITEYKNASSFGLSFRGNLDGRMGYAYSENADIETMERVVEIAKDNASVIESEEPELLFAGAEEYPEVASYNPELAAVPVERKLAAALEMERAALDYDPRIKAADYCVLNTGEGEVFIANTLGLEATSRQNYMYAYVYPRVEAEGQVKVAGEIYAGGGWDAFDPAALGKTAAKNALELLGAKPLPSGRMPVVFDTLAAGDFLAAFVGVFFADSVQKGFSLLKGRLGERVASAIVTLRDDALLDGCLGSSAFDSEGVACANKSVIENGVLKTFLHNLKTAAKDGVPPTGNGFKPGFKSPVGISGTNFHIAPSGISRDNLLERMGDGVLITDLSGLHSGANAVSGDFSLSAEGFAVKGGRIDRPVEQITVAGNFFRVLEDITGVGDDLRFTLPSGSGNIASPSLYVSGMDVSGL